MKKRIVLLCALLLSSAAQAMDITAYEKFKAQASQSSSVDAYMARTFLLGYFSGLADQLNFMSTANMQQTSSTGGALYCAPKGLLFTAEMLQAFSDAELRQPERLIEVLGADWKSYLVSGTLVYGAMLRNYPCR